jgi:NADH-quinone oxidoreductase subunit E
MKGREKEVDLEDIVKSILKIYNYEKKNLISILLAVQEKFNYLPKETMVIIADELKIRLIDVYSVATFYKVFSLNPRGKYVITVCIGTACHVRGGRKIVEKVQKELEIDVGETTEDKMFTLETVRCLGACALGPVMVINGEYHGQLSTQKAENILNQYRAKGQETIG